MLVLIPTVGSIFSSQSRVKMSQGDDESKCNAKWKRGTSTKGREKRKLNKQGVLKSVKTIMMECGRWKGKELYTLA